MIKCIGTFTVHNYNRCWEPTVKMWETHGSHGEHDVILALDGETLEEAAKRIVSLIMKEASTQKVEILGTSRYEYALVYFTYLVDDNYQ